MGRKDTIFQNDNSPSCGHFEFNEDVAAVFDDMAPRSIPIYRETQQVAAELAARVCQDQSLIVDLGCATGETLCEIHKVLSKSPPRYIAVDSSADMLRVCEDKVSKAGFRRDVCFERRDITEFTFSGAVLALLLFTLHFVPLEERHRVLANCYNGLQEGGALLLGEKVVCPDSALERVVSDLYFDFKRRNGYSEEEIVRKRESLENVLVPLTVEENIELLRKAGFNSVEIALKKYNFVLFLALKNPRG